MQQRNSLGNIKKYKEQIRNISQSSNQFNYNIPISSIDRGVLTEKINVTKESGPKANPMKSKFRGLNLFLMKYKEKLCLSKKESLLTESDMLKLDYNEYYKLNQEYSNGGYDPYLTHVAQKRFKPPPVVSRLGHQR